MKHKCYKCGDEGNKGTELCYLHYIIERRKPKKDRMFCPNISKCKKSTKFEKEDKKEKKIND